MADLKLTADFTDLQTLKRELLDIPKKARDSARTFEAEFARAERILVKQARQFQKNAQESQKFYSELLKLNKATKDAGGSAQVFVRELEKQERELDRLKTKYDPLYASSQLYERSLNEINLAHEKGAISTQRQIQLIDQLNAEYQAFAAGSTAATNRFVTAQAASSRGMNAMGVGMQQAGYQVGDFLVQVQSGTNWMVAFGQQATQLVGILPMFNSVMGISGTALVALSAGLGIAIPLLTAIGAAFLRTRSEGEEATETVISYDAAIKNLSESLAKLNDQLLAQQFGVETAAQAVQLQIVRDLKEEEARLEREIAATQEARRSGYQRDLRNLRDQRDATRESREELEKQIEIEAQKTAELKRHEGLIAVQNAYYAQMRAEQEATNNALAAQYQYYADTRRESDELSRSMGEAFLAAQNLDNLTLEGGINAAAQAALLLAQRLGVSLAAARGIMALERGRQMDVENLQSQYGAYGAGRVAGENLLRTSGELFGGTGNVLSGRGYYDSGRGGGRGRSGTPEFVSRVFGPELQKAIEQAQEDLRLYNQEVKMLDSALQAGLVTQQEYNSFVAQAREAYNQAQQGAYDYSSAMEQVESTAMRSMEGAFMSLIDGSKSASDAFRDMAREILSEAMRLLVIRPLINSLFGGGLGGGGGIFGGIFGRASGGSVMSGQPYLVGEHGPELVIPGRSGTVMNADLTNKAMGGGAPVVINQTFQFSANGDDSVKRIIAAEAPKIAALTQKQIVDQRRRGGQMRSVFG